MQFLFLFTFLILFFQILSQNYSIDNIHLNWIDNDDSININLNLYSKDLEKKNIPTIRF